MLYINALTTPSVWPRSAARQHLAYISRQQEISFYSDFLMSNYALGRRRGVRISHPGLKARAAVAPALLLFLHDRFAGSCRSIFLPRSGLRKSTGLSPRRPSHLPDGSSHRKTCFHGDFPMNHYALGCGKPQPRSGLKSPQDFSKAPRTPSRGRLEVRAMNHCAFGRARRPAPTRWRREQPVFAARTRETFGACREPPHFLLPIIAIPFSGGM